MGLSSAFNTSLNGMALNETTIDVLSNNVANAGTNGFKSSETLFATQLARTLAVGSRPTTTNGGTNPRQLGLGATVSTIRKDFTQGSVTTSASPSDLAIQGEGFFVLEGNGGTAYSRNGNFSLNSNDDLVNAQGYRVQGYGVNDNFELVTTQLTNVNIPLGTMTIAQQTSEVILGGALRSSGDQATRGTLLESEALTDSTTTAAITTASLLSNVQDAGANNLFTVGETLTLTPREGGRVREATELAITATTTIADFLTLIDEAYGLHSGGTVPNDGGTGGQPGATVTAAGEINVLGNMGEINDIDLFLSDLLSDGISVDMPFSKTQSADGEGALADMIAYDSLGEQIGLTLAMVLESRDSNSTTFRYFVDSIDDSDTDSRVATGTIVFDSQGNLVDAQNRPSISIDRDNTAAIGPVQIDLDFTRVSGVSSESAGSLLSMQDQDGSSPGTLSNFVIDEGGVINGVFDNGIIRTLGQVVLARFANTQGLLENGDTTYTEGVGTGSPFLVAPGSFGGGTIRSGAIELSNVDLGKNLVDLILASTNYRGNARILGSVQDLVDELLVLGR